MNLIKIKTKTDADSPEVEVSIIVNHIEFAVKPALEPWLLVLPGANFQVPEIADETKFTRAGLVVFDIDKGGKVYVQPRSVTGFFSPELGTYVLVFNGSKVSVKASGLEVETKLTIDLED